MNLVKKVIQPEYEKIRKHVLNLVVRSGGQQLRLASSREMAKEFGVTHMTVARAMKDLVDDNYLIVKPGIGTFTNPRNAISGVSGCGKIFGLITGDGKDAFADRAQTQLTAAFSDALLYRSLDYSLQNCALVSSLESADKEILKAGFDGVVWICPPQKAAPAIKRLKEKGLAVLCAGMSHPVDSVSSVYYDFRKNNREAADMMLSDGRRKIMLLHPNDSLEISIAGMEDAYAARGLKFDRAWAFSDAAASLDGFGRLLDIIKPDGIIFAFGVRPFMKTLKAHLDIVDGCRLYTGEWSLRKDMGYYGYAGIPNLAQVAELAVDNLAEQLRSPDSAPVLKEAMSFKIEMAGDASQLRTAKELV